MSKGEFGSVEVVIKVTDHSMYHHMIEHVDVDRVVSEDGADLFSGVIHIHLKSKKTIPFYGLIQSDIFSENYGFILKAIH